MDANDAVRRVVTGHDPDGRSVFVSDEPVPALKPRLFPGALFHRLWGGDEPPHFPNDGQKPSQPCYFPPVGGFRYALVTLPPAHDPAEPARHIDYDAGLAEIEDMLPGLLGYMEQDEPGMHTTATVDFEVVLSGELILELDDGATVTLRRGDSVVQNGTRHRWTNPGTEPATMAVFIVGAHHDGVRHGANHGANHEVTRRPHTA